MSDTKNSFFWEIVSKTNLETVGELRLLSNNEWNDIEIPLICKELLKTLLRSYRFLKNIICIIAFLSDIDYYRAAFRLNEQAELHVLNEPIEHFVEMGFSRLLALEALAVMGPYRLNKALTYLQLSEDEKNKLKKKKLAEFRLNSVEEYHFSKNFLLEKPSDRYDWRFVSLIELESTCLQLRGQLLYEMSRSRQLKERAAQFVLFYINTFKNIKGKEVEIEIAACFLEGLLAPKKLDYNRRDRLGQYKKEQNCFTKAIQLLPISIDELKQLEETEEEEEAKFCSICFEHPKTHIIVSDTECMHFCLCEFCAELVKSELEPKCPVCCEPIVRIELVRFV